MKEESLSSIKHKYDIAKNELLILISIVNSMYVRSLENKHFELFKEALINLKLNSLSNVSIENIISNANLFLSKEERTRFFKLCAKEYMSFVSHFECVCYSYKDAKDLNKKDSVLLEDIYYGNCIGIKDFPLYKDFSRSTMIDGIKKQFIHFYDEIKKLDVPEHVRYYNYKESIFELFRNDLNDAQNEDKLVIEEHPHDRTVVYLQNMTDEELLTIDYCEFFRVLKNGEISAKHLYKYLEYQINNNQIERLFKEYDSFMNNRMNELIHISNVIENKDYRGMIIDGHNYTSVNQNANIENLSKHNKKNNDPKTLSDMFSVTNYTEYIDILTKVEPKLLMKKHDKYHYIGNMKGQKGCVAYFFKELKDKGKIYGYIDRDTMAKILSAEIENYHTAGSTIDSKNSIYTELFEKQIKSMIDELKI